MLPGSPQDRLLTEQAEASERRSLPLSMRHPGGSSLLEQWRGDYLHPALAFFEHL